MHPSNYLIAKCLLKQRQKSKNTYLACSLKRQGALDAVDRIRLYGRTENGERLKFSKWFAQQLRITADNRIKHLLTTGASQISKSLVNYLVAIDDLVNGNVNIGWIYASRQSMINQQPSQFQAMIKYWLANQQPELTVNRNSVSRYQIGNATANFSYANSDSTLTQGGSAEGKEQNSFQASKLYCEEKSSWKQNVDVTPRLGASKLKSKPIRELGTPGIGTGIEKSIAKAEHNFEPGVICPHCGNLSWLHPLGNLLKPKVTLDKIEYFNSRGEILDFHGTEDNPYVACSNCSKNITDCIDDCELYSRQSEQTIDEFLDTLPEDVVYFPSVSIYLSPLLKVPEDEYRLLELIREGLEPESALIYHQNKLGIESRFTLLSVSAAEYITTCKAKPWSIDRPLKFAGIDQGTDNHYLVEIEYNPSGNQINISAVATISENEIISYLRLKKIDFAVMDNEPGRMSANTLAQKSNNVLVLADQRDILDDYKLSKVEYGSVEIPCYLVNNTLYKEEILQNFKGIYRLNCTPHRKFQKHITSIKRDLFTGKFIRPPDHDDDFFYALMFAQVAKAIYMKSHKRSVSSSIGVPLKKLSRFNNGHQV